MPSFTRSLAGGGWGAARTLITSSRGRRPYLTVSPNGRGAIDLAFSEDNPGNAATGIYYARYRGGRFTTASGRSLGGISRLPLNEHRSDRVRPAHTGRPSAWVHDVASDAKGRPAIVYVAYPSERELRYRYARWEGKRWIDNEIVAAGAPMSGRYAGGISLDHEDPSVVYLSRGRTATSRSSAGRRRIAAGTGNTSPLPATQSATTSARSRRAARRAATP